MTTATTLLPTITGVGISLVAITPYILYWISITPKVALEPGTNALLLIERCVINSF